MTTQSDTSLAEERESLTSDRTAQGIGSQPRFRTRYRDGRRPEEVRMMTPGAPEKLVIDLWPTAITFEKGHRIAVHITSSNSPRFEVNPNTGEAPGQRKLKPRVATNAVYMDETHPSAIVLPVVYPTTAP